MALSANANYNQRGGTPPRNVFGYPPNPASVIWAGALVGLTATGMLQPIQAAGTVAFAGLADRASGIPGYPVPAFIQAMKGTFALTVPAATFANVGAPVYATDDNTCTLSAGTSNLQIGTLAGIDKGQTFVSLLGS